MIRYGQQIDIGSYNVPDEELLQKVKANGWRYFSNYNSDVPEGTPVSGYRIMYRSKNGKLYSAFHNTAHVQDEAATAVPQPEGEIIHDPIGRGFYYWMNSDVAETYMGALIQDQFIKQNLKPEGCYELHRVEGYAKAGVVGDEGDRMQDMYIHPEPLITVNISEFIKK